MSALLVVDSGTTRTRVRVVREVEVRWTGEEAVGARNTAADGHAGQLRAALGRLIERARAEVAPDAEAAVCSGMITANVGLLEVPHLPAPVHPDETASGLVRHDLPEVTDLPLYFVPGVKTLPASGGLKDLEGADMLRGEEAEAVGLRLLFGLNDPVMLMHYGSHHKAIELDGEGRILRSRTAMTGELLAAVREHTVLRGSVAPLPAGVPDLEAARAGFEAAREYGPGRALFLVRVGEQIAGRSREEMTAFLLGALVALDGPLLESALARGQGVVLYGTGVFPALTAALLQNEAHVRVVEGDVADRAAALGAAWLYRRHRALGGAA